MRPIDGTTYICGLIGNPVAHTKSPAIHNFLAEKTGFNLAYGAFPVDTGRLDKAIPGAFALGIKGLNVTVPYKEDVIPLLADMGFQRENITVTFRKQFTPNDIRSLLDKKTFGL